MISKFVKSFSLVCRVRRVKSLSPLRLHTQPVTPNHWLVTQRMNMR